MNIKQKYPLMEEAGAEGAAGGTAAATGTDAGTAAAAAGTEGTDAGKAASLLQTGAAAPAENTTDFIPEKLRVMKEDGTLDTDASARKLAEAYGNLEKKLGSGEGAPKEVTDYTIIVPDAFKEAFIPAEDPKLQEFLGKAHGLKFNQEQLDLVMSQYFEIAPGLVAGATQLDAEGAAAELKKTWATDASFKLGVRNAFVGASALSAKAGIDVNALMEGPLGNNPDFLKLMAAIGPEFNEDAPANDQNRTTPEDMDALMTSEAYTNPKHKDHVAVSAKVKKHFERVHGTEKAA